MTTVTRPGAGGGASTAPSETLYRRGGKRVFDCVASALGLALLSPVLVALAVLGLLAHGRPVLFRQVRPGLQGQRFTLIKFRSMRDAAGLDGEPLPDERRLTSVGRMMRAWSLDELPTLWNVLTGDMSLVGPRPLLLEYLPLYTPEQARRHLVRPGITGWAQVNGRNAIAWEEKFRLDVWYVEHYSIWLDLRILELTLDSVLRRQGISQDGHVTAARFTGSGGTQ